MRKRAMKGSTYNWTSISNRRAPSTAEVLRTTTLLVLSFVVLAPVTWFVLSSFKDLTDFSSRPPMLFPSRWATENYSEAFAMYDYTRYFLNSLFVTVLSLIHI